MTRVFQQLIPKAWRRGIGLRMPRFESAMWGLLAGGAPLLSLRGRDPYSYETLAGIAAYLIFSWLSAAAVLLQAPRPLRPAVVALLVLLTLVGLANLVDVMRWYDWIEAGAPAVRRYQMVLLLLATGIVLLDCHFSAISAAERTNIEVERRVAEKTREIEVRRAQSQEALRRRTLALERQRILADIHDGLGASLISLLRHVQSGQADREHIERRVREALREMRIAIDALQPHEENIGALLGNLRYRLHEMIQASGVRLVWNVDEIPAAVLSPAMAFSLQRILLEAIANALKHSGASNLRLSARARCGPGAEITVEDDGCGFDLERCDAGLGLANMRTRAGRIGASLDIRSRPGAGTVLHIVIAGMPTAGNVSSALIKSGAPVSRKLAETHELT